MTPLPADLPALVFGAFAAAGVGQGLAGWLAARDFLRRTDPVSGRPPITVLKPLHGDEAMLERALESFCVQNYPVVQLVCGVHSAHDAAVGVLERVRARFPDMDIALIVDRARHGPNGKIGNLANMLPAAKHELLVISDSDMHVAPDYLARVADALAQPGVGLITSLYVGLPARRSLPNLLGAAYINQIFASGALVGARLGRQDCLGATMALRRCTLHQVGGFAALAPFIADDAVLGQKVRALGHRVAMLPSVPATTVDEPDLRGLWRHELRWARTIRAVEPALFVMTFLQYPVAWACLACALGGGGRWWGFLAAIVILRAAAGRAMERALGAAPTPLWLGPLRDAVSVIVGVAAYSGTAVAWRGEWLNTQADHGRRHEADVAAAGSPPRLAAEGMNSP